MLSLDKEEISSVVIKWANSFAHAYMQVNSLCLLSSTSENEINVMLMDLIKYLISPNFQHFSFPK